MLSLRNTADSNLGVSAVVIVTGLTPFSGYTNREVIFVGNTGSLMSLNEEVYRLGLKNDDIEGDRELVSDDIKLDFPESLSEIRLGLNCSSKKVCLLFGDCARGSALKSYSGGQ
jgi:hypothetical protein